MSSTRLKFARAAKAKGFKITDAYWEIHSAGAEKEGLAGGWVISLQGDDETETRWPADARISCYNAEQVMKCFDKLRSYEPGDVQEIVCSYDTEAFHINDWRNV